MATAEIDLGNGRTAEVEIPEGADPGTYVAHAAQMLKAQTQPQSRSAQLRSEGETDTLSNIGREIARPVMALGREVTQGAQQAFAPKYNEPNAFDRLMATGALGAPGAAEASQKYISTPVSQVLGLMRMLFPAVGAMAELGDVGTNRLARSAGASDEVADVAGKVGGTAAGFAAPTTGPLDLVKGLGRLIANSAMRPIQQAEATNTLNGGLNVFAGDRNAAQQSEVLDSLAGQTARGQETAQTNAVTNASNTAARAKALADAQFAEGRLVTRNSEGFGLTSPAADALKNPLTNEQAYSFMGAMKPAQPVIPLKNLESASSEIVAKLEGTPRALQPSKVVRTAEQISGNAADASALPPGMPDASAMSDTQKAVWGPVLEQLRQSNATGGLTLDKVDEVSKGLGELTHSADPRTAGMAKRMYREMFNDLRAAAPTNPAAAQYLAANRISAQNLAARDIADIVTYNGTRIDKLGRLTVNPGQIEKLVAKDDLLAAIPPEQKREFIDTLNNVFHMQQAIPSEATLLPEIVPATKVPKMPRGEAMLPTNARPQAPSASVASLHHGLLSAPRLISSLGGGIVGHAAGIPYYYGAAAGNAVGAALPRLIFSIAMKPQGRAFLNTLYRDAPPMVNDTAKFAALMNYVASQGQAQ